MNKARRHEIKMLKYKKRIKVLAAKSWRYTTRNGINIPRPKAIDLIKDNAQHVLRSTSTPCSCYMCSSLKFDRAKEKISVKIELEYYNEVRNDVIDYIGERHAVSLYNLLPVIKIA